MQQEENYTKTKLHIERNWSMFAHNSFPTGDLETIRIIFMEYRGIQCTVIFFSPEKERQKANTRM